MKGKDRKEKVYFSDPKRYADIWNGFVYGGEQVIKWQELIEESPVQTYEENGKSAELTSDIIMKRTKDGQAYGMLIVENQETTDYSMPIRILMEEILAYDKQVRQIKRKNASLRDELRDKYHNAGEYLYRFFKTDRVRPVATLVLYWGEGKWDGATTLKELIDFTGVEDMERLVPNYPIRIINVGDLTDASQFQTELKTLLELYVKRNDWQAMQRYVDEHPDEMMMDKESREMLAVMTRSKELITYVDEKMKEENKENMWKAIEDMIENGRNEGIKQSIVVVLENIGIVPEEVKEKIFEIHEEQTLKELLTEAARAKSIDEFVKVLPR